MKKLVIDSSVTIKWLNEYDEQLLDQADELLRHAQVGSVSLYAPELSKYEIGNALLNKKLDLPQAYESLGTISQLPIIFVSESEELAKMTYRLAQEYGITYYDASFGALAKQEKATLVTANLKHQGRMKNIAVVPLSNYI